MDIITGTNGQHPIADMRMNQALAKLLGQIGIPTEYNNPYDTDSDYPDFHYMRNYPGRVIAVDFRKTDLCEGSGENRSFHTTHPVVDKQKVTRIAETLKEALRQAHKG